jgi:hypothetical protein
MTETVGAARAAEHPVFAHDLFDDGLRGAA